MRRRNRIALMITIVVCSLLICGCILTRIEWETETPAGDARIGALAEAFSALEQALQAQGTRIQALEEQFALPAGAEVDEGQPQKRAEDEYSFDFSADGGVIITSYHGTDEVVIIPATLGGGEVIAIGEGAFRNGSLQAVVLPDGVRRVDWFAFSGCHRLQSVTLPASVVEIGYGAFERCAAALTFVCPRGCYAEEYAQSYGFSVERQ